MTCSKGSKLALLRRVKEWKTPSLSAQASFAPFSLKVTWSGKSLIDCLYLLLQTYPVSSSSPSWLASSTMDILAVLRDANRPSGIQTVVGNGSYNNTPLVPAVERLEDLDYFKLHPALTWCYLIVMVVSTVMGLVGNVLVGTRDLTL